MTKLVQNDLASLTNEQSALAALNANYALLETFSDNVLARDGTGPNQMQADLDMNSNRILNLPIPLNSYEPLRLKDLTDFLGVGTVTVAQVPFTYASDYGVIADGLTDNSSALTAAFTAVNSRGGGTILLPVGVIGVSSEFAWGDGTNGAPSTKHNRICLQGVSNGLGYGAGQAIGTSVIRYIGSSTDDTKAVLNFKGPLHTIKLCNLEIDANDKLGRGIIINHVNDFLFENVTVRQYRVYSYEFTTRTGFPSGAPYGCSNGTLLNCYAYDPFSNSTGGIKLTSGVSTAVTLVGNPATSSVDIINGEFFYGGSASSYGIHVHGADNNTVLGCKLLPDTGNDGTGKSIFFEQWTGSPSFPLENVFTAIGASQNVGGTSGTGGNTFVTFHTGDGAILPAMANVHVIANNGKLFATAGAFPNITDACALGSTALMWSDLFLASGAVININNGNATMTHSAGNFTFSGAAAGTFTINTSGQGICSGGLFPSTNDGAALGNTGLQWSDLFLATGAVLNFNNGNATLTHSAGNFTFSGAAAGTFTVNTSGQTFSSGGMFPSANDSTSLGNTSFNWSDLFLASGAVINFNSGNLTLTHSAGAMAATGDWTYSGFVKSTNATSGVGYATGAGGAVTQITSRTTGVTLNKICGAITLVSAAGSAAFQAFTVTDSAVAATDTVTVVQKSGTDKYEIHVTAVGAGTFEISYKTTGGTTVEQPVFNFTITKAVAA